MSGIAGIAATGKQEQVKAMLGAIQHRGRAGSEIVETKNATLGVVWTQAQANAQRDLKQELIARDDAGSGHFALAQIVDGKLILKRDPLGVAPLYYGRTAEGVLCFASEMKAMLKVTRDIHELFPGCTYDSERSAPYFRLEKQPPNNQSAEEIVKELRRRLDVAVRKRVGSEPIGVWLSGGLDSSTMAALARQYAGTLYTFSSGLAGAPDLEYARAVADFIKSKHYEVIVGLEDLLNALPHVIYHLESFDALLVRSSITNYLVSQRASEHVAAVFSGEGGDEFFAGYAYLKSLDPAALPDELIDIADRLHNTALQRVDRSASAHGTIAHVVFCDPEVFDYALRIPVTLKIHDSVEKWILRRAMDGALPEGVLKRTKAKFWQGAGVGELLAAHALEKITDAEFHRERALPNGWKLNSKEELMYYRVFKEHFGDLDLDWMGRTKGAPVQ